MPFTERVVSGRLCESSNMQELSGILMTYHIHKIPGNGMEVGYGSGYGRLEL